MSPGTSSTANPLSASLLLTESSLKPSGPDPLSVTVTLVEIGVSLWFGGHRVLGLALTAQVGAMVSTTFTVNEQLLVLRVSVAPQLTDVLPKPNPVPEEGVQPVLWDTPQLSGPGCGVAKVTGVLAPVDSTVMGPGQLNGGGMVSRTVTVPVQVLVASWESVTVKVTSVPPKL